MEMYEAISARTAPVAASLMRDLRDLASRMTFTIGK